MRKIALFTLAFAVPLALAAPAHAAFPGDNGKILFATSEPSHTDAYTVNPDGSGFQGLIIRGSISYTPRLEWSADGSRLAAGTYNGFLTYRADGTDERVAVTDDAARLQRELLEWWKVGARGNNPASPLRNFGAMYSWITRAAVSSGIAPSSP